jgi:hypothetical protein
MSEVSRDPPEHDSDYDGAWKEALRLFLPAFIEKYFPAEYAAIDWSYEPEWLDKELSQILGQAGQRNRAVDVLVKVRLTNGQSQWILVHVEVQTSYEPDFALRIARYNAGLTWAFQERVLTLVILGDLRRNWMPDEDLFRLGTFEYRLKFPICKLLNRLEGDWRNDHSLPVLLARTQVEALRTAGDPEGRYRAKSTLVRGIYDLGYNADDVRQIFKLIDWMMHLRADLEERFRIELTELEEERKMPYVTSIERMAEARGQARLVLALMTKALGNLPDQHQQRVRSLNSEQLEELALDLLEFQSPDDLERWLDTHAAPQD